VFKYLSGVQVVIWCSSSYLVFKWNLVFK